MSDWNFIIPAGQSRKLLTSGKYCDRDIVVTAEGSASVLITAANISEYFTVENSSYYFAGVGSVFTSNNGGVKSSTATTKLTAKTDMKVEFGYSYSSEANYDKFTLSVGGTTIENTVSGSTTAKTYSGTLAKGSTIVFTYAKDSSQDKNDDKCSFYEMTVTAMGGDSGGVQLPELTYPAGENDVREGKEYIGADGKLQYGRLKMDGVFTPDWSDYVPMEVQYDSDDRYLVMTRLPATSGGGGGLETVTANINIYGGSTRMICMTANGVQTIENPYGNYEVVKNSPVCIIYDGSTTLVEQGGSGFYSVYDNSWQYSGHSCHILTFYESGSVTFEEK